MKTRNRQREEREKERGGENFFFVLRISQF